MINIILYNYIMNIIEKSENDNRIYKWIELKNKLKVVIVRDDKNKNCGALLNINVGSIHDTLPGMAHFLEHMVFMGSKKYPNVTNFFDNVSKNGGNVNAMTSDTDTTYYFSVDTSNFLEILDMFSDFFIEPLLRKDQIDKEINAIDSESTKNLLSESWISVEMVKKCMFDDYPINHYTCGTKKMLGVDNNYILMKEFFDKYYSANIMQLILFINDKFTDTQIIDFLHNSFEKIKNNDIIINNSYGNIIKPNQCVKYIHFKDTNKMIIVTEIPIKHKSLLDNPLILLQWIFENRTENSLYDILNKKKYIISMIFDTLFSYNDYMIIIIEFELTEDGYKNIDDIIQIYFEYIKSIKSTKISELENIYNDIIKINKNNYQYPVNNDIVDTMMHLVNLLNNKILPQNLLNYLIKQASFENILPLIKDLLNNITLHNSSVIIGSNNIKLKQYAIDDIYNIKYKISRLDPIKINKGDYKIISTNKYINTDLKLIKNNNSKLPEKINKKYNLFYNFNDNFCVPDVNIYILLENNKIFSDPKTYLEFSLFLDLLVEDNMYIINDIKSAGYNIGFQIENTCLYIYISGNNKNIGDIVNAFINIINKYVNDKYIIDNNENINKNFDLIYETFKKSLKNFVNISVINKINHLIYKKLLKKYYSPYELLKYIKNINFEDCRKTFYSILKQSILSILVSGNIYKDDAINFADKIYDVFEINTDVNPIFKSELKHLKTPYILTYYNYNKKDKNCLFTLLYKLFKVKKGENQYADKIIFLMLLNSITSVQYFNIFRTDKQYGYVVYTKLSFIGNKNLKIGYLKFIIQSPSQTSEKLYTETLEYIKEKLFKLIENLGDEGLNEYKDGILSGLENKYNNLSELDIYLCSQIFDYSYDFNYKENLIDACKNMSYHKFMDMFTKLIIQNNDTYSISINPYISDNDNYF
jgi:insulysin